MSALSIVLIIFAVLAPLAFLSGVRGWGTGYHKCKCKSIISCTCE